MKRMLFALSVVALVTAFAGLTACSGNGEAKKSAPTYPACETDEHCAEHGEFCVHKMCRECGKNSHCKSKGPCLECKSYKCTKRANCCTSDKDCPQGERCIAKPGRKEGTCSP